MQVNSDYLIKAVIAREILDSRGNPTVEVEVYTNSGISATASTPSGASTGKHEARELRDSHNKRFFGKGVLQATANVNEKISSILVGRSCYNQQEIDQLMVEADVPKICRYWVQTQQQLYQLPVQKQQLTCEECRYISISLKYSLTLKIKLSKFRFL